MEDDPTSRPSDAPADLPADRPAGTSAEAAQEMFRSPEREDLQAEILEVFAPPEAPKPVAEPTTNHILETAVRYIRGKRGGDLLAILLVGSGVRRTLTLHSDLDLIVVIKGQVEGEELIRIATRHIDIRYRGLKAIEQELPLTIRLPPLLRKAHVLFDLDGSGIRLVERAGQVFRQGPPALTMNDRIRLKAECDHLLGKVDDLHHQPATARYLLTQGLDTLIQAAFRLKGLWPTAPADTMRFLTSRDRELGQLVDRVLTTASLEEQGRLARQILAHVFQDTPQPPRVD